MVNISDVEVAAEVAREKGAMLARMRRWANTLSACDFVVNAGLEGANLVLRATQITEKPTKEQMDRGLLHVRDWEADFRRQGFKVTMVSAGNMITMTGRHISEPEKAIEIIPDLSTRKIEVDEGGTGREVVGASKPVSQVVEEQAEKLAPFVEHAMNREEELKGKRDNNQVAAQAEQAATSPPVEHPPVQAPLDPNAPADVTHPPLPPQNSPETPQAGNAPKSQ